MKYKKKVQPCKIEKSKYPKICRNKDKCIHLYQILNNSIQKVKRLWSSKIMTVNATTFSMEDTGFVLDLL